MRLFVQIARSERTRLLGLGFMAKALPLPIARPPCLREGLARLHPANDPIPCACGDCWIATKGRHSIHAKNSSSNTRSRLNHFAKWFRTQSDSASHELKSAHMLVGDSPHVLRLSPHGIPTFGRITRVYISHRIHVEFFLTCMRW